MVKIHRLRTPIMPKDIESIDVGDVVYIDGIVITARDRIHKLVVEGKRTLPRDLTGLVLYHAGPAVSKDEHGWHITSIGPTTSMRMEPYEYEFIKLTGVRVIVGKGFMGEKTAKACKEYKAIVAVFPGGCGALAASQIKRIIDVVWLDLGVPEAMWILEVENFGPLIVTIDAKGNNLYDIVKQRLYTKKYMVLQKIKELMVTQHV